MLDKRFFLLGFLQFMFLCLLPFYWYTTPSTPTRKFYSLINKTQFEKGKDWLITIKKTNSFSFGNDSFSWIDPWRGKDDTIIPGFIIARPRWCIQDLPLCRILNKNSSACWLDLYKHSQIMEECTKKSKKIGQLS